MGPVRRFESTRAPRPRGDCRLARGGASGSRDCRDAWAPRDRDAASAAFAARPVRRQLRSRSAARGGSRGQPRGNGASGARRLLARRNRRRGMDAIVACRVGAMRGALASRDTRERSRYPSRGRMVLVRRIARARGFCADIGWIDARGRPPASTNAPPDEIVLALSGGAPRPRVVRVDVAGASCAALRKQCRGADRGGIRGRLAVELDRRQRRGIRLGHRPPGRRIRRIDVSAAHRCAANVSTGPVDRRRGACHLRHCGHWRLGNVAVADSRARRADRGAGAKRKPAVGPEHRRDCRVACRVHRASRRRASPPRRARCRQRSASPAGARRSDDVSASARRHSFAALRRWSYRLRAAKAGRGADHGTPARSAAPRPGRNRGTWREQRAIADRSRR